ncbi:MAG TPA: metallophosphoesterase [Chloroflexia bacterium]|nr:metallophosphoesterase [Chloroflexia bacterium]
MKIAAFSDIHANLPALEAVLEDIEKLGQDVQIVVAGDIVNCGPFPRETLSLVRALPNSHIIAGNHEEYVLEKKAAREGHQEQELPVPYRALFAPSTWTASQLSAEELEWLANLPRQSAFAGPGGSEVRVVHGSPRHQTEGLNNTLDEARLAEIFEKHTHPHTLWISGHTHFPAIVRWRGMTITNCGSAGAPYDGDTRACYLLAEWDERRSDWYVEHRRVEYNREEALAAIQRNAAYDQSGPFMRLIYQNLKLGRPCDLRGFVSKYVQREDFPAPPADFEHLDRAIDLHLAQFAA